MASTTSVSESKYDVFIVVVVVVVVVVVMASD